MYRQLSTSTRRSTDISSATRKYQAKYRYIVSYPQVVPSEAPIYRQLPVSTKRSTDISSATRKYQAKYRYIVIYPQVPSAVPIYRQLLASIPSSVRTLAQPRHRHTRYQSHDPGESAEWHQQQEEREQQEEDWREQQKEEWREQGNGC
jgi:hypothetical protein